MPLTEQSRAIVNVNPEDEDPEECYIYKISLAFEGF